MSRSDHIGGIDTKVNNEVVQQWIGGRPCAAPELEAQAEAPRILIAKISESPGRIPALG